MAKRNNGEGSIRRRSDGRWEGRYFDPLIQKQKSVYGKTQKEVIAKIKEITREIDDGTFVSNIPYTMGDWLKIWIDTYNSNVKPLTYDAYAAIIKNHIIPIIGEVPLQEIQTHHIQAMYNFLINTDKGKGLSVKTVKNVHCVMHKSLEQAQKMHYVKRNTAEACVLPKHVKREIMPMDEDTINDFLKTIQGDRFANIYFVTLFTGLRQGEVLGLKWEYVDFKKGIITIKKQLQKRKGEGSQYYLAPTKNNKERILCPPQLVMDILYKQKIKQAEQKIRAGGMWNNTGISEGLVFTDETGKHLVPNTVYKHYKKLVELINKDKLRFHDLRHSFAVISLENGDNVKVVQEALGHHSAAFTLDTYGHVTSNAQKESAKRMQNFIEELKIS